MILKREIHNYVFITDEGSTFVEWEHKHANRSGSFTKHENDDFKKVCQIFYNENFAYYEMKLIHKTSCIELIKGSWLVDWEFYNKFELEQMSLNELREEGEKIADRNNVQIYAIDFTQHEELSYLK